VSPSNFTYLYHEAMTYCFHKIRTTKVDLRHTPRAHSKQALPLITIGNGAGSALSVSKASPVFPSTATQLILDPSAELYL
jgi:hypothetical protein